MTRYPIHYGVDRPAKFTRLQLLVRFVAFLALGMIGLSFGTIFFFAYLALPVYAASRVASRTDPHNYVTEDGPRVVRVLHWFAAVSAWAGLIAEQLPKQRPSEIVHLDIEPSGAHPTTSSAIWRVLTGLPSAFVLMILGWLGVFVWLWAALSILFVNRVGPHAFNYLVGLQRWSIRLLAYQASLVDEYPPFSFSDTPPALPQARAAS